ncbi:MAG TPA: pseudouridine synthase [Casimicrobiaceae bacterium]|nr:pseudouridine synthase [Casimicrobiaceae bacterium]
MPTTHAQPSLALQRIAESLPPRRHKSSTDEIFSEPQRLHKILASCGFGSRRAMEELIIAGRITVNRMPAEIGQKVGPGDEVRINGEPVKIRFAEPKPRVLLYHKPTGELVTRDDPQDRPTVFEDLPAIKDGKWIAVGRLDYNTEGLLVFTNSGELANRLMHPRYEVEREYAVRVMGRLTDEQRETLLRGVDLDDGPAKCEKVEDGGGDEDSANHWYNVTIKEGRNREVRRLFEALGLTVSRLIRTRYGRLAMPSLLKRGDVMEMEPQDVTGLLRSVGLRAGANASQQQPSPPGPGRPQPRPANPNGSRHPQRGRRRGPHQNAGQGNVDGAFAGQRDSGQRQGQGQGQSQGQGQGNRRQGQGQAQGQRTSQGVRPGGGQGNGKRHGQRPHGQHQVATGGPGKPPRRHPRSANAQPGNSLGSPGNSKARPGNSKRRRTGPKSHQNAQPGTVRDRRVGMLPPGADGREPHMPIVTHKKRRTVVAETIEPWSVPPRDDESN